MSVDEVPLQEIPTMTMCLDDRKSSPRNWLSFQNIPHEIHYFKTRQTTSQLYATIEPQEGEKRLNESLLLASMKLQEGKNQVNGNEMIILTKLPWCYSVTFKVGTFDEEDQALRVVKVVFPKNGKIY